LLACDWTKIAAEAWMVNQCIVISIYCVGNGSPWTRPACECEWVAKRHLVKITPILQRESRQTPAVASLHFCICSPYMQLPITH